MGNLTWERSIPISNIGAVTQGTLIVTPRSNLVFSSYSDAETELVGVNADGAIEAHRMLSGDFRLVRSVGSDDQIQIFGYEGLGGSGNPKLITFDAHFLDIRRIEGAYPLDFDPHLVYRLSDQSLVIFGSGIHNMFGSPFKSRVVHADYSLHSGGSINFDGGPITDFGFVGAAAPTGRPGEFAIVRGLLSDPPVGMALNFVQIN
jgi:hypothetical protein